VVVGLAGRFVLWLSSTLSGEDEDEHGLQSLLYPAGLSQIISADYYRTNCDLKPQFLLEDHFTFFLET